MPPYPVVGVADTGIQLRLELRDLQENPIQFSLFIQAMNQILGMTNTAGGENPDSINNPNSWWQMGGIHGLPYNPWSGDPGGPREPNPDALWKGYCYHASALFPTWHRVLLLLIEQAVVREAIAIATGLGNDEWLQAARQLRFPFWDWTRPETATEGIPQLLQQPRVNITNPDGSTVEVDNPLNHYDFTVEPGGSGYMSDWNRTYRWADQNVNPTEELYDQALQAFSAGFDDDTFQLRPVSWLRAKVAGLFTYDLTPDNPSYGPNMWGYFSNTGSSGVEPPMALMPPSIEESHNMIHLNTGGNGTMSVSDYAGFDPIFYLHHCNVDRLYAFWEYVYPNYWIETGWMSRASGTIPFVTDEGSFSENRDAIVKHSTGLTPFRNQALAYWTSDDARGLLTTGPINKHYTYPAIRDPGTGVEVKVDAPYDVNDLALRQQYQQILYNNWSPEIPAVIQAHRDLSTSLPQHTKLLMKEENGVAHLRHFTIIGHVPEFAYPGSYRLELYLHPKGQHQTVIQVVNSISVLGRADPERCAACKQRQAGGSQVRGHMQLDPRIILYLIDKLSPDERAPITEVEHLAALVHESFAVRLVKPDGTRLAAADPHVPAHHPPLEEAKTPKLTLHSHVIQVKPADATVPIKLDQHAAHGTFGKGLVWKAL